MSIVENWLERIGLGYSIGKFRESGIVNPEDLILLTFEDYDKLGITNVMHRRTLFELINKIKRALAPNLPDDDPGPSSDDYGMEQEEPRDLDPPTHIIGPPRKKLPKPTRPKLRKPTKYQPRIQVVVRKRPINNRELNRGATDVVKTVGSTVTVREPKEKVDLTKYVEVHEYAYDQAFDENTTTEEIYESTAKILIDNLFNGGKATCFAYGQTGSGKTFTMLGGDQRQQQLGNTGIYLLAAQDIFSKLEDDEYRHLSLMVSFFEIYGGKIFDLLNGRQKLRHLEDAKKNVQIVGLQNHLVNDIKSLISLIYYGNEARSMGSTGANADSSRSHAVLQLSLVESKRMREHGRFSFIDLAGSERGADTGNSDKTTRLEGAEINKSLLALKECIRAMYNTNSYTPFRGSTLTQVLKDSFVGNCSTLMIAAVSPGSENVEHTLNTLRYAYRVKEINGPEQVPETEIGKNAVRRGQYRKTPDYIEEEIYDNIDDNYNADDTEDGPLIHDDEIVGQQNLNQKLSASQVLQTRNAINSQENSLSLSDLKSDYINMHSTQMDLLLTIINDEMQIIKSLETSSNTQEIQNNVEELDSLIEKKIEILNELKEQLYTLKSAVK